jgi:hypothetical protein
MSHPRRISTVISGVVVLGLAFAATAPAAFAIIPGPTHATTVDARYNPPAHVTAGQPADLPTFSHVQGHPVATGSASVRLSPGPGPARHHGRTGRQARQDARRQPDPAPVLPAAGHTGIRPA